MKHAVVALTILLAATSWAGEKTKATRITADEIGALSAVVMDQKTHRVLWSKRPDEKRYPASTTKIMTALLVAEKTQPREIVTAPDGIEEVGESSLHLQSGEMLSAEDMLYAIMLRSANDACATMALQIGGSLEAFAKLMNDRAKALGCTGTHFSNPHGLHDPEHYTTARDLALIASAAMENSRFAAVAKTWRHKVTRSTESKDLILTNHNRLLKDDKECIGVKTGWTVPAGKCFVGAFDVNGRTVITVVMGSKDWMNDTTALENWAAENVIDKVAVGGGQSLGTASVVGGAMSTVSLVSPKGCVLPWVAGTPFSVSVASAPATVKAPIKEGQPMGEVLMKLADGSTVPVEVVAATDVPAKPPIVNPSNPGTLLIGCALVGGWAWMRRGRYASKKRRYF